MHPSLDEIPLGRLDWIEVLPFWSKKKWATSLAGPLCRGGAARRLQRDPMAGRSTFDGMRAPPEKVA